MAILLFSNGCNQNIGSSVYDIEGKVKNGEHLLFQLEDFSAVPFVVLDTARITKGTFRFKGYAEEGLYRLRFPDAENAYLVIYHKRGSRLTLEYDLSVPGKYTISGNKESAWIQRMTTDLQTMQEEMQSFNLRIDTMQAATSDSMLSVYRTKLTQLRESYKTKVKAYIDGQETPLLAAYAMTFYGDVSQDISYFIDKTTAWIKTDPKAGFIKQLHEELTAIRERILAEHDNGLPLNSSAPEIALPNAYGDTISLSSLKGKVVLLDFWASWCQPCRHANPSLVSIYKQFNTRGLEIFSVSLDKNKEQWRNAIIKDGLLWRWHVSDLQMWKSSVLQVYRVNSIPTTYLIDNKGVIRGRNMNQAELLTAINKLLPTLPKPDSALTE